MAESSEFTHDFAYVHRITASAIGPPGQRVFYVQSRQGIDLVSMLAEKEQVGALASSLEQLLEQLGTADPRLATTDDMLVTDMRLEEPVEPMMRVTQMGLGYDTDRDMLLLIAQGQSLDTNEAVLVRLAMTRAQARALSVHAARVVAAGRPICVQYPRPCNYRTTRDELCPFCPDRN